MNAGVNASEAVASGGFSQWFIIILVIINIGISYYQFKQTSKIREREIEDHNIRHREMLKEQREQFDKQLQQMKEQHAKELEVNVVVESQKDRIEDIRQLTNDYLLRISELKKAVYNNLLHRIRDEEDFKRNLQSINESYFELTYLVLEAKNLLEFRLSEIEKTDYLIQDTNNLYNKTKMTPIEILNCDTFKTPDGGEFPLEYKGDFTRKKYNNEQNTARQQLFDETSDYLKSQWSSLYNKINSPEV
ncbi:hypothetical protein [Nosocomiicoccus ampullae]|uniref:Uncharacterized protein n=1 Tax=Nosocomiicoccus ampullae TaxID=489910 RepID=A0A9Q2CXY6_9STAP|nr:hypothetical protein [Nosocomiicoccus ampullae]MBB5175210.1 hypothetical protein [Nosocomiicoccus ampullae]QYA46413.1 hypothetical protein KPF49_05255 [Nosocomiicoccus ampullae]